ncbi:MAG: NADPH-dependent FMN reductase [Peptococcaceae bacterium BRH_c4a]|nr:MAG: NADPH-dependent FMN reductase [Peptococcaceae bacterium BRH_c4a]
MLFLALNGSPHKDGNTASMLKSACSVIEQTGAECVFVQVSQLMSGLKNQFCLACSNPCSGRCYSGTGLEEVYGLLARADGIIIGSPVYFCTVSGQMKAFWDKTRLLRKKKALLNTVGGALAVGGARFGGQETTLRAIHDIMLCHGMTVVGDGYHDADCGHQGGCAQSPSREDAEGLKRAAILARRVCEVASATRLIRVNDYPD